MTHLTPNTFYDHPNQQQRTISPPIFPILLYQKGISFKQKFWFEAYMSVSNFPPSLIKRKPFATLSFSRHWAPNIAIARRPVTKWKSPRQSLREHLKTRCVASRDQRTRQQAPAASRPASRRQNSIRVWWCPISRRSSTKTVERAPLTLYICNLSGISL